MLHHHDHDRLEAVLRLLTEEAAQRAEFQGADIDVLALASVRATREASVHQKGQNLPCISGVPESGQEIGKEVFDGKVEAAIFPGDLPIDPRASLQGLSAGALNFVKFRPPLLTGQTFPHIRLDRAVEFLIGDRFP